MLELLLHGGERLGELGVDPRGELLDERFELLGRLLEVAALLAHEGGALAELGALRLGQGVHGADALAPAQEPLDHARAAARLVVVRAARRSPPGRAAR